MKNRRLVAPPVSAPVALADRRQDRRRYPVFRPCLLRAMRAFSTESAPKELIRKLLITINWPETKRRQFGMQMPAEFLSGMDPRHAGPLLMRRCLTRWVKMGGTRRDFVKGQIRARHEDSPKDGEFRAWHGFAADTRLGIFEGGTGLRRTLGSGLFRHHGVGQRLDRAECGQPYIRRWSLRGASVAAAWRRGQTRQLGILLSEPFRFGRLRCLLGR